MADWTDETFDEMMDICAEIVENNNTYDEMVASCSELKKQDDTFNKIFEQEYNKTASLLVNPSELKKQDDTFNKILEQEYNKTASLLVKPSDQKILDVRMDFTRIKEIFFHMSKLISNVEWYLGEMNRQMKDLREVGSICEQHEYDYHKDIEYGKTVRGVVYGTDVTAKGASTITFNPNNVKYILKEENYKKLEITINRMGGMMNNLIIEAEENQKIVKEISEEAYISNRDYC